MASAERLDGIGTYPALGFHIQSDIIPQIADKKKNSLIATPAFVYLDSAVAPFMAAHGNAFFNNRTQPVEIRIELAHRICETLISSKWFCTAVEPVMHPHSPDASHECTPCQCLELPAVKLTRPPETFRHPATTNRHIQTHNNLDLICNPPLTAKHIIHKSILVNIDEIPLLWSRI